MDKAPPIYRELFSKPALRRKKKSYNGSGGLLDLSDQECAANYERVIQENELLRSRLLHAEIVNQRLLNEQEDLCNEIENSRKGVHDAANYSRRYTQQGSAKSFHSQTMKREAVPLWGFEKPNPLEWIVAGFLPKGFITLLAADGGVGKSFLAIYLAIMVCLGRPFLGLGTIRGRVLYVDYELDEDEQKRRVWRVLAGLKMTPADPCLKDRFFYYRPSNTLSSETGHDEVLQVIRENKLDLVILDSLTIGLGADATSQQDVTRIMQRFKDWGTVFAIDHISGQAARGNQSKARPFGSVFKRNIARATFTLARADAGGHLLTSDKNNFGPQQDLLCYALDFLDEGERVCIRRLDHADEEMAGAMQHMSTHDTTLLAVKSIYQDTDKGVSPDEVVTWRRDHDDAGSVMAGTVRNHFTVLKKRGKIELLGDGTAVPAVHGFIHDGMNNDLVNRPKQHKNGHSRFTAPIDNVNRESAVDPGGDGTPGQTALDDFEEF